MYEKIISSFSLAPQECLIIEDNENGIKSAKASGAHVLIVNPPFEPKWVWWVLPTVLITPVIFWWNFKILK